MVILPVALKALLGNKAVPSIAEGLGCGVGNVWVPGLAP